MEKSDMAPPKRMKRASDLPREKPRACLRAGMSTTSLAANFRGKELNRAWEVLACLLVNHRADVSGQPLPN